MYLNIKFCGETLQGADRLSKGPECLGPHLSWAKLESLSGWLNRLANQTTNI